MSFITRLFPTPTITGSESEPLLDNPNSRLSEVRKSNELQSGRLGNAARPTTAPASENKLSKLKDFRQSPKWKARKGKIAAVCMRNDRSSKAICATLLVGGGVLTAGVAVVVAGAAIGVAGAAAAVGVTAGGYAVFDVAAAVRGGSDSKLAHSLGHGHTTFSHIRLDELGGKKSTEESKKDINRVLFDTKHGLKHEKNTKSDEKNVSVVSKMISIIDRHSQDLNPLILKERCSDLLEIAGSLQESGENDAAIKALGLAVRAAELIDDPKDSSSAFIQTAKLKLKTGDKSGAQHDLNIASSTAQRIGNTTLKINNLQVRLKYLQAKRKTPRGILQPGKYLNKIK